MPIYEYSCSSCGRHIDVIHGIQTPGPTACEVCGGAMRKELTAPAIHFKGSGWAKKDARAAATPAASSTAAKDEGSAAPEPATTGAPTEPGTETKAPAAAAASTTAPAAAAPAATPAKTPAASPSGSSGASPASDWITLAEAAEIFAAANVPISTSTLARWARDGKLQSIRPGRRIYVRRAQVRSLLTPRRRGVPAELLQAGMFEDWPA